MNLPSKQEIDLYYRKFNLPKIIKRHSALVSAVAVFLGNEFKKKGYDVNLELLEKACLLHDLFKPIDFVLKEEFANKKKWNSDSVAFWKSQQKKCKGKSHEFAAYEFFKDKFPELARLILIHKTSTLKKNEFNDWNEKIIYYADKRVLHDRIVSLNERLEDGAKRYGDFLKREAIPKKDFFRFEKGIFNKIRISPDELLKLNHK